MRVFIWFFLLTGLQIFAGPQALSELVYEIRDPRTDSASFREALEKIGEYLALHVLDEMNTKEVAIHSTREYKKFSQTPRWVFLQCRAMKRL